jgi:hypothetical protein
MTVKLRSLRLLIYVFLISACTLNETNRIASIVSPTALDSNTTVIPTPIYENPTLNTTPFSNASKLTPSSPFIASLSAEPSRTRIPESNSISTVTPELLSKSTATFDAARAFKATLSPPAECPQENPNLVPSFIIPEPADPVWYPADSEDAILGFLNAGGTRRALMNYLIQSDQIFAYSQRSFLERDLTNDGVPELVLSDGNIRIFACKDHRVYTAFEKEYVFDINPFLISVQDMNLDGIPELLIGRQDSVPVDKPVSLQILGWDGNQFEYLIAPPDLSMDCVRYNPYGDICAEDGWIVADGYNGMGRDPWAVRDIDQNGTRELVIIDGVGHNYRGIPMRARTTIFMWNGNSFTLFDHYLDPPSYRFEALQDGDVATLKGKYDQALDFYQQVIFNDKLDWWTDEKFANLYYRDDNARQNIPTPTMTAPDPNEYNNLAAYARYRIMLVDLLRGDTQAAQVVYETLQIKFPSGISGHDYAEMASVFWTEYQETQNISQACKKTVGYADQHQEGILYYISHRFGGSQLPRYKTGDICPF